MRWGAVPDGKKGDPNLVLMLSLYLLLLAFFILLNALSHFEEDRARVVLRSVNGTFNGRVEAWRSSDIYSAALGPLEASEELIDGLGRLFDSLVPAVKTEVSPRGPLLRLELAAELLFQPGTTVLQDGREELLRRFAEALLRRRAAPLNYELELLHGVPAAGGAHGLEVERVGALARDLVSRGVPAALLSTGIVPGRPDVVQIAVRLHEVPPRPVDFADVVE